MSNAVTIEMTTTQVVDDQRDVSVQTYAGRCDIKNDVAILQYVEENQGQKSLVKLELRPDGCLMEMSGAMQRTMDFIPGKRTRTKLMLPVGELEFGVHTNSYRLDVIGQDTKHMQVVLKYYLYSGEDKIAENQLEICVKVK
ncbi:MAG: DUF1934 domain-containing protein [Lachnospiraceae bacterium]|nr:DUF1934 domain-containing protein [Lachnospiraceae bacterium]